MIDITVAAKKIEGQWEAALISSGRFSRAFTGDDLKKIIFDQLQALLSFERKDETEVSVILKIDENPDAKN